MGNFRGCRNLKSHAIPLERSEFTYRGDRLMFLSPKSIELAGVGYFQNTSKDPLEITLPAPFSAINILQIPYLDILDKIDIQALMWVKQAPGECG